MKSWIIGIIKLFYIPQVKSYNVWAMLPYEYSKSEQLSEFQILAYNQKEAELIAQSLIREFNNTSGSKYFFHKTWFIHKKFDLLKSGKVCSLKEALGSKLKLPVEDLYRMVKKHVFKKLQEDDDFVFTHDLPKNLQV